MDLTVWDFGLFNLKPTPSTLKVWDVSLFNLKPTPLTLKVWDFYRIFWRENPFLYQVRLASDDGCLSLLPLGLDLQLSV